MVLYFSGTGNDFFVARFLSRTIGDEDIVSLNDVLKEKKEWRFHSDKPFVFVCPIYAWRYPRIIENVLSKGSFLGTKEFYFVATMGFNSGNAWRYLKRIVERKEGIFKGFADIRMPDNYLPGSKMPTEAEAVSVIRESLPKLKDVASRIREGKSFLQKEKDRNGWLSSSLGNWGFDRFMKNSRSFYVGKECILCQKCIRNCPMNNIGIHDGRIVFHNDCMFCLSCIHGCPVHAISYRKKDHGTYQCPKEDRILE